VHREEFDVTLYGNPAGMALETSTEARWLCVPGFRQVCPCQFCFTEAAYWPRHQGEFQPRSANV